MGGVLMFRSERMRRTGAPSTASGTSSHMQSWADCITGTLVSSFWKRQADRRGLIWPRTTLTNQNSRFADWQVTEPCGKPFSYVGWSKKAESGQWTLPPRRTPHFLSFAPPQRELEPLALRW